MSDVVLKKLDGLRTELADLAFVLERTGRLDAADLAMATSARLEELQEELATERLSPQPLQN